MRIFFNFFFLGLFLRLEPVVDPPLAAVDGDAVAKPPVSDADEAVLQVLVVAVALEPLPLPL